MKRNKIKFFNSDKDEGEKAIEPVIESKDQPRNIDETIVVEADDDFEIVKIWFVDGFKYKLQHPGNREYGKWKSQSLDLTKGQYDGNHVLDKFFEHCVFPEGHSFRPSLDNIKPSHVSEWIEVCSRFLSGRLEQ